MNHIGGFHPLALAGLPPNMSSPPTHSSQNLNGTSSGSNASSLSLPLNLPLSLPPMSMAGQMPMQMPMMKKVGKWCAMHVRIAWEIYNHQQRQQAQNQNAADALKLGDFSSLTGANSTSTKDGHLSIMGKGPLPPSAGLPTPANLPASKFIVHCKFWKMG